MPIDEQRHFRPPTGDSSAANNYDRKEKGKRVRGSVESRNSARRNLVTRLRTAGCQLVIRLFQRKTGMRARSHEAVGWGASASGSAAGSLGLGTCPSLV